MDPRESRGGAGDETTPAAGACLGGCVLGLAPLVGGLVGLIVGEARVSDEFLGDTEVLGYGLLGAAIGLGVGLAIFLAASRR
jgi:hypothetical protein